MYSNMWFSQKKKKKREKENWIKHFSHFGREGKRREISICENREKRGEKDRRDMCIYTLFILGIFCSFKKIFFSSPFLPNQTKEKVEKTFLFILFLSSFFISNNIKIYFSFSSLWFFSLSSIQPNKALVKLPYNN